MACLVQNFYDGEDENTAVTNGHRMCLFVPWVDDSDFLFLPPNQLTPPNKLFTVSVIESTNRTWLTSQPTGIYVFLRGCRTLLKPYIEYSVKVKSVGRLC